MCVWPRRAQELRSPRGREQNTEDSSKSKKAPASRERDHVLKTHCSLWPRFQICTGASMVVAWWRTSPGAPRALRAIRRAARCPKSSKRTRTARQRRRRRFNIRAAAATLSRNTTTSTWSTRSAARGSWTANCRVVRRQRKGKQNRKKSVWTRHHHTSTFSQSRFDRRVRLRCGHGADERAALSAGSRHPAAAATPARPPPERLSAASLGDSTAPMLTRLALPARPDGGDDRGGGDDAEWD